jgi:hypothetical protein
VTGKSIAWPLSPTATVTGRDGPDNVDAGSAKTVAVATAAAAAISNNDEERRLPFLVAKTEDARAAPWLVMAEFCWRGWFSS